jgi:hypothetical protein
MNNYFVKIYHLGFERNYCVIRTIPISIKIGWYTYPHIIVKIFLWNHNNQHQKSRQ